MQADIEHRKIAPEPYIRTQRSTVAHIINWKLVFDYKQYLRQTFYLACSALKICYDRIVHSADRLGTPLPSIISMLDKIQCMEHKVRTAYGDSNLTYGGDTVPKEFRHFMMGICQGNSCAPQLWSNISSIYFLKTSYSRLRNPFSKLFHDRNSTAGKIYLCRQL